MRESRFARQAISLKRWIWLIFISALTLTGAYLAGTYTLATVLKNAKPDQAFALAPWDGDVAARYARTQVPTRPDSAQSFRTDQIAKYALHKDGIALDALVALGLDAQIQGKPDLARRYFELSQRLSHRDLQTNLWAIENAVAKGDVADAVRHYDIALRTSREARQLLFPVLASAITDRSIMNAMVQLLADHPYWASDFIFFLAKDSPNPLAAATLFDRLDKVDGLVGGPAKSAIISNLISKGKIERAWNFQASHSSGMERSRSRDPHFANDQDSRSAFDWQLFGDSGISTSIERGMDGNELAFSVPPGAGGLLIRQMQLLPPGSYILRSKAAGLNATESSRLQWSLTCIDGRSVSQIPLNNSADEGGTTIGYFDIESDCPVQYLSLIARSSDIGISGNIIEADVRPM
ncbi:hypothetical protein [Sphingomonas sp. 1185]|uniref:hypothetical protein n=1 Tax=Sphingomonas sp. 1185 TaxID=3156411 RepID=UPI00339B54FE